MRGDPSGWLFGLGWEARRIDPDTFAVEHYTMAARISEIRRTEPARAR